MSKVYAFVKLILSFSTFICPICYMIRALNNKRLVRQKKTNIPKLFSSPSVIYFSVFSRMRGASRPAAKRMQLPGRRFLKINPDWSVVSSKNAKRHRLVARNRDFETKV